MESGRAYGVDEIAIHEQKGGRLGFLCCDSVSVVPSMDLFVERRWEA